MSESSLRPAVFCDRDGTLNVDRDYLYRAEAWQWLPGVPEGLATLAAAGFALVVVTNQSGIARGLYTEADMQRLHAFVQAQAAGFGARFAGFYHCPHLPAITGACDCRKPKPGLLLRAAEELGLDMSRSWAVGDSARDVQAAQAAGCRALLVGTGNGLRDAPLVPHVPLCADFPAAVAHILAANDLACPAKKR